MRLYVCLAITEKNTMKHYTFSNYLVTEENRAAFDAARAIADLKPAANPPVLLLGDDGSGKTHLLYAIVNRLRASSSNTGLAYLTPTDFPDSVRQLIDDPSRVERANSAVLLVDQLDAIDRLDSTTSLAEELDAVVRIFMDNNHFVVFASNTHPNRLRELPEGLKQVLEQGTIISLPPHGAEAQARLIEEKIRREQESESASLRAEIATLKADLARKNETPAPAAEDSPEIAQRLEVAKAFSESLQQDLDKARAEIAALRAAAAATTEHDAGDIVSELDSLRSQAAEASRENQHLHEERERVQAEWRRATDRASELDHEVATLREQLQNAWKHEDESKQLRDALEQAREHITRLENEIETRVEEMETRTAVIESEKAEIIADRDRISEELNETRARHDAAAQEATSLLQRAEGLVELVEANRARFRQVEETQRQQIEELEQLIAERAANSVPREELESAQAERDEARAALESLRGEHTSALAELNAKLEATAEERDNAAVELTALNNANESLVSKHEQLTNDYNAIESELNDAKQNIARLEADLTYANENTASIESELTAANERYAKLEAESAGNLAAANARIGDLESRLITAEETVDSLRQAATSVSNELTNFSEEMRAGADELAAMANRADPDSYELKQQDLEEVGDTFDTAEEAEPHDAPEENIDVISSLDTPNPNPRTAPESLTEFPEGESEPQDTPEEDTHANAGGNGTASNGSTINLTGQELPAWDGPDDASAGDTVDESATNDDADDVAMPIIDLDEDPLA